MITAEKQGSVQMFFAYTGKSKENYSSELCMHFSLWKTVTKVLFNNFLKIKPESDMNTGNFYKVSRDFDWHIFDTDFKINF